MVLWYYYIMVLWYYLRSIKIFKKPKTKKLRTDQMRHLVEVRVMLGVLAVVSTK